jgi:hypothetical protein
MHRVGGDPSREPAPGPGQELTPVAVLGARRRTAGCPRRWGRWRRWWIEHLVTPFDRWLRFRRRGGHIVAGTGILGRRFRGRNVVARRGLLGRSHLDGFLRRVGVGGAAAEMAAQRSQEPVHGVEVLGR